MPIFKCVLLRRIFKACTVCGGIHIERIERNLNFWTKCVILLNNFFITSLLPELEGNWYTRPVTQNLVNLVIQHLIVWMAVI